MKIPHSPIWFALLVLLTASTACNMQGKPFSPELSLTDTLHRSTGSDVVLQIDFFRGPAYNHPSFALWLEDASGAYLRTIYVTKSVASGIFGHGQLTDSTWSKESGPAYRPAALPYWFHKKGPLPGGDIVPRPEAPFTDAVTGATPRKGFTGSFDLPTQLPNRLRVVLEINQTWDWNQHWHTARFPTDYHYRSSAQPSVVYAADIDWSGAPTQALLQPIGHGHYSGADGQLYPDLSTLTTALQIAHKIEVRLR